MPPFKDDSTVAHGGENYAFRDWFNGKGVSDGSENEALKANGEFDPISRPHICTVYRSTQRDHSGTRPWIVEVVQPLRYPDGPTGAVVGVVTSGINVRLDLGDWLRDAGQSKADLRSAVWVIDCREKLAWRNELQAQDDAKDTKPESYAAVIEQLKDNERADERAKDQFGLADPLTGVELIAVRQPFYPLSDGKDGADAWHVVVSQPRDQALRPVQQLSAKMIEVAGLAAAGFAAVAALLWFAVYREYRKVSVPD